jgi:hypothetical protein
MLSTERKFMDSDKPKCIFRIKEFSRPISTKWQYFPEFSRFGSTFGLTQ